MSEFKFRGRDDKNGIFVKIVRIRTGNGINTNKFIITFTIPRYISVTANNKFRYILRSQFKLVSIQSNDSSS